MPATWVETREIPLDNLTRYPGNARRGNVDEIRRSIRRHGQYRAIVVRDTGAGLVILAGNHTADALHAEGTAAARCEVITCSDDEARRIVVADNRMTELGTYDNEALAAILTGLDGDYDGVGWYADDVDDLLAQMGALPEIPAGPTGARWAEPDEQIAERQLRVDNYQPRVPQGTGEVFLIFPLNEREEFTDLIGRVRVRDGKDLKSSTIVLAAMRAYAPAGGE